VSTIVQHTTKETAPSLETRSFEEIIARWPSERPLVCTASGGPVGAWNRYSIIGLPRRVLTHDPIASRTTLTDIGDSPKADPFSLTHDPMADLARALESTANTRDRHPSIPFVSGWIGTISYEMGRAIEPRAAHREARDDERRWPLYTLYPCPGAIVHDRLTNEITLVGDVSTMPELSPKPPGRGFTCTPFASDTGRDAYESCVARAVEYTHAGDIYQANIAHRLSATFTGSPRAAFARILASASPWFGGFLDVPDESGALTRAVASASPELFLRLDRDGRLTTRPIKGTLPADRDAKTLLDSEKNAAELAMIVDLMRNDIGRVCAPGRVRVTNPRELERHAPSSPLHHTTATVEGDLRDSVSRADILRATFPPGSITGAPKVRAMQIIDELETHPRGPYTGAIGLFPDDGAMTLNVAIRTGAFTRAHESDTYTLDYHAGAGIVADSDPSEEWLETLDKARGFARALGATIEGGT
jgi:anthranilate/para-aminobenzoate synthase component I